MHHKNDLVDIVKAESFERPIAGAFNAKSGPHDSGAARLNIPEWLQPHDEQTFYIAEKPRTPAAALLKQELAMQNADLLNSITAINIVEEVRFVISMQALANSGVVGLADIEQPVKLRMEVRIKAKAI